LDSVYTAADNKKATMLVDLDISAAFDTIDHEVLLTRFQTDFGVDGTATAWLHSYLADRRQYVKLGPYASATMLCQCRAACREFIASSPGSLGCCFPMLG
jgi:Reverse transcriptase (RNA-dependent DNA polymerase)